MKKFIATLLAGACISSIAQAKLITYDFTGTVDLVTIPKPSTPYFTVVDSATILGNDVVRGGELKGRFTFDSETPASNFYPIPGHIQAYISSAPSNSVSAYFQGGLAFQSIPMPNDFMPNTTVRVSNDWQGEDGIYIQGFAYNTDGAQSFAMQFSDMTQTAFDTEALPLWLNFNAFQQLSFVYDYASLDTELSYTMQGKITSLTAVPEPASVLLMLSGLGLLAARRRISSRVK